MKLGPNGQLLIKAYEDLRLKAYLCPAGVWTIGWGHTGHDVYEGLEITIQRAEELFRQDTSKAERAVNRAIRVATTQDQFDAMVSLSFNVGIGAFAGSTLIKRHNDREFFSACDEFLKWQRSGGKRLRGLKKRRCQEAALYCEGRWIDCSQ